MEHYIEFPALGWKFPIDDTLVDFTLFGIDFSIKWYAVCILTGLLLAFFYGLRRAKEFDVNPDHLFDAALVATLMGFVGARLYYVFFNANTAAYLKNPITILQIWKGGLGIYGGIIFAFLFGIIMCRYKKINIPAACDLAALGFPIGQALGRWGNFFNQEAFGGNTTLPWGMTGDVIQSGVNGSGYDTALPVHPTFLYESLWCALGFLLLHIMSKKAYKFKGQIFCSYLMWYGVGRFFIEGLRTDSLMLGSLRLSQLVAVITVVGAGLLMLYLRQRAIRVAASTLQPIVLEENGVVDSSEYVTTVPDADDTDESRNETQEDDDDGFAD